MSSIVIGCAFCGINVGGYNTNDMNFRTATDKARWAFEFRALCKDGDGPAFLTGVGLYDDPEGLHIVPPVSTSRWDDPEYDRTNVDDALGAMHRIADNGRHGYIFHDVCWRLLQDSAPAAQSMNLQRLFDLLSSLPFVDDTALNWGHGYGGLEKIYTNAPYPWGRLIADLEELELWWTYPLTTPPYKRGLIDIEQELHEFPIFIKDENRGASNGLDPFSRLPEDVVLAISQLLPTTDFFNARLASGAFWNSFHCQSFWLSRFAAGGERSWIFEMRKAHRSVTVEPQLVYRCSAEARLSASLKNRRRICELLAGVHDLLETQWISHCTVPEFITEASNSKEGMWHEATANIKLKPEEALARGIRQRLDNGCQFFKTVMSAIPSAIACVTLYFSVLGDKRYISGIAICCMTNGRRETAVEMGYRSKRNATYRLPCNSRLIGFALAIAADGIRGMQIHSARITDDVTVHSGWYGDVEDCAKSLRAMTTKGVSALKVGFDGCKMVSIGVAETALPKPTDTPAENAPILRQQAVWHADIPSSTMHLNENVFSEASLYMINYYPLFWTLFGGSGGVRLSSLTSFHVFVGGGIFGIRFGYNGDTAEHGPGTSELGQHLPEEFKDGESVPIQSCSIDGPGGERINAISERIRRRKPRLSKPFPFGLLNGLKLFTNRGHCHVFGGDHAKKGDWQEHLRPEPGTTIVGFYSYKIVR